MTILLTAIEVKHETRVRLFFTNNLASGAFGVPAPGGYTITSVDGMATPPGISAALLVPSSPGVVELSFNAPLVHGALYNLAAVGIPASDSSTTDSSQNENFRWGLSVAPVNVESDFVDKELLLYGIDLIWNGEDYQESATGDLDRVKGTPNVTKALNRAVLTNPGDYPYATGYGAGAREFVDSPSVAAGTLRGSVAAQLLLDPRVKAVKVTYDIQDEKTFLFADPVLISGEVAQQVSIEVPNQ